MSEHESFSPFVIYGPSKSGTTWLQKIVDAHPDLRCHFQLQLFPFLVEDEVVAIRTNVVFNQLKSPFKGVFRDAEAERKYWVQLRYFQHLRRLLSEGIGSVKRHFSQKEDHAYAEELILESYRALVPHFLMDVPGKKAYGIKSTTDLDFLFQVYPKARVISILRDGRDVATSKRFHMQKRGGYYHGDEKYRWLYWLNAFSLTKKAVMLARRKLGWFGEHYFKRYDNDNMVFTPAALRKFSRDWYLTTRYILDRAKAKPDQFHMVRYEALKKDQARTIAEVFAFLGVRHDEEVVRQVMEATEFKKLKGDAKDSFFRKGSTGDWKNYFTPQDKKLFKETAGSLLLELGYEQDENW